MRNLKKVLSLVLVFAMACTMMAGAAYGDQKDIVNTDAVNMLSALNIIKGGTDGNFNPEKTVTRAEMAKMIYVLKNSGNDDGATYYKGALAGPNGKPVFSDTTGHWAQGYINWAYSLNIINGRGNGKFDPDASVTGLEAAKMLLTVLGYKPTTEGMTGTTWAIRTAALASESNLFEDYTPAFNAGCPRDYAAQMIYNAIFAKTVVYRDGVASKVGYDNKDNKDLGELAMDLKTVNGTLLGNGDYLDTCNDGEFVVKTTEAVEEDNIKDNTEYTATYDLDLTYVGEEVKVLYKEGKNSVKGLDTKDTIYGVTPTGKTKVYTGTRGNFGDNDNNKIKFNDTKLEVDAANGVEVITNFNSDTKATITGTGAVIADTLRNGSGTKNKTNDKDNFVPLKRDSMDTVKIVLNDNNKVSKIYVTNIKFAVITGATSSKVTFAGKSVDIADISIYDGAKKDDVVSYTCLFDDDISDDDAKVTVTKADVIEGKVTAIRNGGKDIKIGDKYYGVDNVVDDQYVKDDYTVRYNRTTETSDFEDTDEEYTVILSGKYWVAAEKGSTIATAKKLAVVEAFGTDGLDIKAKVMLSDGTEKTYVMDEDSYILNDKTKKIKNLSKSDRDALVGQIFIYSINSSNEIKLHQDGQVKDGAVNKYSDSSKTVTIDKSRSTDKSCVAFVYNNTKSEWKVYMADTLDTIETTDLQDQLFNVASWKAMSSGNSDVVAFVVKTKSSVSSSSSDRKYGFTLSKPSKYTVGGDDYSEVDVWNGTDVETLKTDSDKLYTELGNSKGLFIEYKIGSDKLVDTDDVYVLTNGQTNTEATFAGEAVSMYDDKMAAHAGAVEKYDAGRKKITLYGGGTYAIADDVKIIYVNCGDTAKETSGSVTEALQGAADKDGAAITVDGKTYKNNVVIVVDYSENDGDGEVTTIFVDSDNEMLKA